MKTTVEETPAAAESSIPGDEAGTLAIDTQAAIEEIKQLDTEINGAVADVYDLTYPKACRQGEVFTQLKQACGHGNFMEYCRITFPDISHVTICSRMRLYANDSGQIESALNSTGKISPTARLKGNCQWKDDRESCQWKST
jgi:hypothetical protein